MCPHSDCRRKSCGCKLQMSRHMQSTCKTMWPHGNCGGKPCGRELQKFCHTQITLNAHEEPCDHMVFTGKSHVDTHTKHMWRTIWPHGNYGQKTCGCKSQMSRHMQSTSKPYDHMVIAGGSYVDVNYRCFVTCKGHGKLMRNHVITL